MSADELTPAGSRRRRGPVEHGRDRARGPHAVGQQRHLPRAVGDHHGIYKPVRGERPLWDFEPGLHRREIAAYRLSQAMGIGPSRPPSCARTPRSARARCSGSSTPTTASTTSRSPSSGPICTTSCGRSPCSTSWPTTPTARAATACWRRVGSTPMASAAGVGDRQRSLLRPRLQAAHRHLGVRRRVLLRPAGRRLLPLVDAVPAEIAELIDDDEVAALQRRAAWLAEHRVLPGDDTATAIPGR